MITGKVYTWFLISVALLFSTNSVLFGAIFVVTNTNNQGPGSLRQAIENVNNLGGATNEVIISLTDGKITVFLLSELPTITKQVTLNGFDQVSQQPLIIDGNNNATVGLHISGADASNSRITNTNIQNINNDTTDAPSYGFLIESNANNCSITECTITNIFCGVGTSAEAAGIRAKKDVNTTGDLTNNIITNIQSADNPTGDSGSTSGMLIETIVNGDCSHNIVSEVTSGDCDNSSGNSVGIYCSAITGNYSGNSITSIHSGTSINNSSGAIYGILSPQTGGSCSNNNITDLTSGNALNNSGTAAAIGLTVIDGNCSNNIIANIKSGTSTTNPSGAVDGILTDTINSNCLKNTITNLHSGASSLSSGDVNGISIVAVMSLSHNTIEQLQSGDCLEETSGTVVGIEASLATGQCSYNTVNTLMSGSGETSGDLIGISISTLENDCHNNLVKNLTSGNEVNGQSGVVVGIQITTSFSGNCLNNTVCNLAIGQSTANPKNVSGINVTNLNEAYIACNQIQEISGTELANGLIITAASNVTIQHNNIHSVHAPVAATGLLGSTLTNSLIIKNSISDITADNGIGIFIAKDSTGNDILTNSIFDISSKAISIFPLTDVQELTLTSVRCSAGNRIGISGTLIPEPTLTDREFLIQFFVSDSNTPEQIKTFIGECEHDSLSGESFDCSFVVQAPTKFGQFITATATALPTGSGGSGSEQEENLNTSEVSNALFACETNGGVCTIATCPTEPIPAPIDPCLLLSNCSIDDVL